MLRVCDILRRYKEPELLISVQGVGDVCIDKIHAGVVFLTESDSPKSISDLNLCEELANFIICFGDQPLHYSYKIGNKLIFTNNICWNNTHFYTTISTISKSDDSTVYYKGLPITDIDLKDGNILLSTGTRSAPCFARDLLDLVKMANGIVLEMSECGQEFKHIPADIGGISCEFVS